jgi:hypothetical protein
MHRSDRHVGEHSGGRNHKLIANLENNLAFEDVKAFFFPAMDMRWRTATWSHYGFTKGVPAIRILAGRQKTIHVANHCYRAALVGTS